MEEKNNNIFQHKVSFLVIMNKLMPEKLEEDGTEKNKRKKCSNTHNTCWPIGWIPRPRWPEKLLAPRLHFTGPKTLASGLVPVQTDRLIKWKSPGSYKGISIDFFSLSQKRQNIIFFCLFQIQFWRPQTLALTK
jgi:hypothetical protein